MQSDFYFNDVAGKVSQNDCKHSEHTIRQNSYLFPVLLIKNYDLHQVLPQSSRKTNSNLVL